MLYAPVAYPDSGTKMVQVEVTAPADGVLRSSWDNRAGWRERVVYHRHDVIVAAAVSAAPPVPVAVSVSGVAVAHVGETPAVGGGGGGGGGSV